MTMFSSRSALAVVEACCSTARHVPSARFLCRKQYAAIRGWHFHMPPRNQSNNEPHDTRLGCAATVYYKSPLNGRQWHKQRPAASGDIAQSKSIACGFSWVQMTKAHQALTRLRFGQATLAESMFHSSLGARLLFFKPDTNGFTRYAKDALQAAQRTAFLIGIEDLFFLGIWIALWLWIVTTTTIAVMTPVTLFAIWRTPIAYYVLASAVVTFKGDSDHQFRLSTIPLHFSTTKT